MGSEDLEGGGVKRAQPGRRIKSGPRFISEARAAALKLGQEQAEVTIDDVREVVPPPEGVDPRVMGAVFRVESWRLLRHERSRRSDCHHRPVGVWRLKEEGKSLFWPRQEDR